MLNELFKSRLRLHIQEIGKYSRLILNDHLSIVLVMLIGFGGMVYYEQYQQLMLIDLTDYRLVMSIVMALWWGFAIGFGRNWWLTRFPDTVYLISKVRDLSQRWRRGYWIGFVIGSGLFIVTTILSIPIMLLFIQMSMKQLVMLVCMTLILKWCYHVQIYLQAFYLKYQILTPKRVQLVSISGLFITLYSWDGIYLLGYSIMTLVTLSVTIWAYKMSSNSSVNIQYVVNSEEKRMDKFYQLISLFATVPGQSATYRHYHWLTVIMEQLNGFVPNQSGYLYLRQFVRRTQYSTGVLYLTVISCVGMVFVTQWYWSVVVGIAVQLLSVIQIVSLMPAAQYHPFQQLQNITFFDKIKGIRWLLWIVLSIQWSIWTVIAILQHQWLLPCVLLLSEAFMIYGYTRFIMKKYQV